jgi:hypothetical protein
MLNFSHSHTELKAENIFMKFFFLNYNNNDYIL